MTSESRTSPSLTLAALRGVMGDWIYYISLVKMKDLVPRVSRTQSLYSSTTLQELLQREVLPERTNDIARYLASQKQRFFNALVIGTYGGSPKWQEVKIKSQLPLREFDVLGDLEGVFGLLKLSGNEKMFAIDGQHRVEGMRIAIQREPKLGDEEVCVILVKGIAAESREKDPSGFERTRRLFSTLNRYAKPVSKHDIIAIDEDDVVAIITRRLVEEYGLFSQRKVSIKGKTSVPVGDKRSFTSIQALYDGLDIILRDRPKSEWKKFKRFQPAEAEVKRFRRRAIGTWEAYCRHFRPLAEIKASGENDFVAQKYRNRNGGHLLFRPIGLLISLRVVRNLLDYNHLSVRKAVERVSKVPMDIASDPWVSLLWNPVSRNMINRSPNQIAAERLLFNAVGGRLTDIKSSADELKRLIAGIQEKEETQIALPSYFG